MIRCRQCGIPMEESKNGLCAGCDLLETLPDGLAHKKTLHGIPFMDMKTLDEVKRIKAIVEMLQQHPGKKIMVMVDSGPGYEDKADRWIAEIRKQLPQVRVNQRRKNSPVREVESIFLSI
jgi:hypothetical protein